VPYMSREIPPDTVAPVLDWDDFMTYVFDWQQSQHVGLIGPTESGKSTLQYAILPRRKYVTFFATKPRDKTLDTFAAKGGFQRIEDWPPTRGRFSRRPLTADEMPRRLLWPDATRMSPEVMEHQRQVFLRAFHDIYGSGGWCVVWDEFWMMTQILGLEKEARIFLQQARSNDISFVMGMQRPSRIPLEVFDQSTHLFFWRDNDEANLKRMGGIGWMSANQIRVLVANLEPHQVLYLHTRRGWMYRTTAPELKAGRKKK
jgi:hypothetical protein